MDLPIFLPPVVSNLTFLGRTVATNSVLSVISLFCYATLVDSFTRYVSKIGTVTEDCLSNV